MVCHTVASSSPPDPDQKCTSSRRPTPQPTAAAFAGAVATGLGLTVVESTASSDPNDTMGVEPSDHAAHAPEDLAISSSTVTTTDSDLAKSPKNLAEASNPTLAFCSGALCIPHPEKADKGGEDAYFVQKNALGVFDGVGGWASIGVDAGLYSKELALLTANYLAREGSWNVVEALKNATEKNQSIGSSTACVVGLRADKLVGVNLGDSGLIVIRDGNIVYRTSEQQHYFNCPYQIGTDSLDTVDVGGAIDVTLRHGDWIIMGTDGLWDNLFPNKIVDIVQAHNRQPESANVEQNKSTQEAPSDGASVASDCSDSAYCSEDAQQLAVKLAMAAGQAANDERCSSPFALNAQSAGHLFLGGKVDDITIISALVVDPEMQNISKKEACIPVHV